MSADVDLSQLAIRRDEPAAGSVRSRPRLITRYVLPIALGLGLIALMAWAAREVLFPAKPVKVIPVLVTDSAVQREGTPLFRAAGWVEPRPTATRVAALAPGVVKELRVVEDQPVKPGQIIAKLVDDDARLALRRARADLELRLAELEEAESDLAAAKTPSKDSKQPKTPLADPEAKISKIETELANVPFELRRAKARLKVAQEDLRGKTIASGVVTGVELDRAESEVEAATALVESLEKRANSLRNEKATLTSRRDALRQQAAARIKSASARVEQARVAEAEAELRFQRMTIRSPIAGRVLHLVAAPGTRLVADKGNIGTSDGSTVVTLYQPERLQVRVDVRFDDLPKIQLEQPVRIESAAVASPLMGQVLFISSLANIQRNTLEVKVAIDSPPPVFKPDMLLDLTFLAPKEPEGAAKATKQLRLYVPKQLVQTGEDGSFVWVADQAAGVARRVSVEAGAVGTNGLVEITKGLNVSSRLIVGSEGLADGDRIRVTGEDANLGTSDGPAANRKTK